MIFHFQYLYFKKIYLHSLYISNETRNINFQAFHKQQILKMKYLLNHLYIFSKFDKTNFS